jgi:hypothetical protein
MNLFFVFFFLALGGCKKKKKKTALKTQNPANNTPNA